MATLYEISEDLLALKDLLDSLEDENGEPRDPTPEEIEQMKEWFDCTKEQFETKADNYCKLIKNLQLSASNAEAEKKNHYEEQKRLTRRSQVFENRTKYVKANLQWVMERLNMGKLKTDLFSLNIQNTAGSVTFSTTFDVDTLPEDFLKPREPSVQAIRDAIKNGLLFQKEGPLFQGKLYWTKDETELKGVQYHKSQVLYIR